MSRFDSIIFFSECMILTVISSVIMAQEVYPHRQNCCNKAEQVVDDIYDLVTFGPDETPDWDKVRSLFIPEAVIVLRTARNKTSVFTVDSFIQDFITFIQRADVTERGFEEKIIQVKKMIFGDMASIQVLYEAHIPGSEKVPQQGVDNFSLIHKDNRWWIVSITNEIPTANRPLPDELR